MARKWDRRCAGPLSLILAALTAGSVATAGMADSSRDSVVQILFIHHSCGGQLLADQGPAVPLTGYPASCCVFSSHPNGGGLRRQLEHAGFVVNEASYGSRVGQKTDIPDWPVKFATMMSEIIKTRLQDEQLSDGKSNRIVVFKSCYPNNEFVETTGTVDPSTAAALTVPRAQAAYRSLLPLFAAHPEILFVAMTAPPIADPQPAGLRGKITRLMHRRPSSAYRARQFNTWLANAETGWLAGYPRDNVMVFDYYNILTNDGATDWSAYPTQGGRDSHPSAEGNAKAGQAFVAFIREAVKQAETN